MKCPHFTEQEIQAGFPFQECSSCECKVTSDGDTLCTRNISEEDRRKLKNANY